MRFRSQGQKGTVLTAVFALSIVGHAAAVAWIKVGGIEANGPLDEALAKPLVFECESDAALAAAARMSLCATPFRATDDCMARALKEFDLDQARCQAVEVAMVDPESLTIKPLVPFAQPKDELEAAKLVEEEVVKKLEEQRKPIESPKTQGQVIEITKPTLEKAPEKARFLSEFDSAVAKEQVARAGTEKMVARPGAEATPAAETPRATQEIAKAETPGAEGPKPPGSEAGLLAMRGPGLSERPTNPLDPGASQGPDTVSEDGIFSRRGETLHRDPRNELPGGQAEPGSGLPRQLDLKPSSEFMEKEIGGGSVDKLDGVASGDETALNSKQWKFASFFNRMKRQVAQNWHPDQVYIRRDPSGRVYGTKDRLTVLQVSLHPDGRLAGVVVADKSGVGFLDDEAINAFRQAQPFPNPPKGLVDENQLITFHFGFHFEIGDRANWKIFRAR